VSISAGDDGGVDRVELYMDGTRLATDTTAPYQFYWDTSAHADGSYELWAIAHDSAGNQGQSDFIVVSVSNAIVGDTVAPTVSVTSPQGGATISGATTVSVSASDDSGVDRVQLYIDGSLLGTDTTAPYQFYWDTNAYADGNYELQAIAYDSAGNQGQSTFITVSVSNEIIIIVGDTVPPDVAITSPRDGASISDRVTINASASDSDGISKMELYLDGVLKVVKTKSALTWRWNARKASKGAHTISVKAFDAAGNVGEQSITVYK